MKFFTEVICQFKVSYYWNADIILLHLLSKKCSGCPFSLSTSMRDRMGQTISKLNPGKIKLCFAQKLSSQTLNTTLVLEGLYPYERVVWKQDGMGAIFWIHDFCFSQGNNCWASVLADMQILAFFSARVSEGGYSSLCYLEIGLPQHHLFGMTFEETAMGEVATCLSASEGYFSKARSCYSILAINMFPCPIQSDG